MTRDFPVNHVGVYGEFSGHVTENQQEGTDFDKTPVN